MSRLGTPESRRKFAEYISPKIGVMMDRCPEECAKHMLSQLSL